MIWLRLAASLLVLLGLLAGATIWRASARGAAAEARFPPDGGFVSIDGTRVHYVQKGQGPDVVLIHGASGSTRDFQFGLMQALSEHYRVTAFDRPGLGYTDSLPQDNDQLAAQAGLLRGAAAELGLQDILLVGQSYGGAVSLAWALQEPPRALVMISSPSLPWPGKLDPWYQLTANPVGAALLVPLVAAWVPQSYVDHTVEGIFAPNQPPEGYIAKICAALSLRVSVLRANAAQVNSLRPQIVAQEAYYPRLTMPIELLHGDADTIVPLAIHSAPLAARLPSAHLTVLPGIGHMPHHNALPEVLAAIDRAALRGGLR